MDRISLRVAVTIVLLALTLNLTAIQPHHLKYPSVASAGVAQYPSPDLEALPVGGYAPKITPVLGDVRVLVLAVTFQDINPSTSILELRKEWFGTVPAYYHEVSFGKLTVEGDIYGWYRLPHPESYYGRDCHAINDADCSGTNQSWKIANDTISLAEKDVNFSNYDYYVFLHAGTGQETSLMNNDIWSVTYLNQSIQTPTKTITRFNIVPELEAPPSVPNGVWCVEFAHNLGVPDLYDTTKGPSNGKTILGPWDLMDKGSWNGDPAGSLPAHMTAWAKIRLGWINGSMLFTAPLGTSETTVDPTEVASNQVHAIRIPVDTSENSDYYLVEVRKQIGFDSALPTTGVLITFVNETQSVGIVRLINSNPGEPDLSDAAWQPGQTFTDSLHRLTVTVTSESGNSYEITVSVGTGSQPAIKLTSTNSTDHILIAGALLTAELATDLRAQENDLSGLPSLPSSEGILFVSDHEDS